MEPLDRAFARYRHGRDPAALGEVFDLAAPEILRVATYLVRDRDLAEDLVQLTFLGAIESAGRFDEGRPVMPWLLGILANQARGQRRRQARAPDAARLPRNPEPDPAVAAGRREIDETIRDAIERIDEPYRAVLRMSLAQELTPKEIAESLDRPQGTVRSQLHRCLELLRKALPLGFAAGALGGTRGLAAIKLEVLRHARSAPTAALATGVAVMTKKKLALSAVLVLLLAAAWGVSREWGREPRGGFRAEDARRPDADRDGARSANADAPTAGGPPDTTGG